ncbi:MAG: GNAT family N-acetyltransferase [Thermoplasmata archaeon]|nr:GNAT family N-acetyltransferase [Thermoplasmata archaeon]
MSSNAVPPVSRLVDALESPAETLRLIAQCRDALHREGKSWADFFADYSRRKIEDGSYRGLLWWGPGDEAVALVSWEVAGDLGKRAGVFLAEGYQRRSVLEAFLIRLQSSMSEGAPFISWSDDVPGVSLEDRDSVFGGRGFYPVTRADMRFPKEAVLPTGAPEPSHSPRALTAADEPLIADLLYRVYEEDPVERALFATTANQREDARRAAHGLLHGEVGRWIPEASFGIVDDGRLVGHTLGNDLWGGLISEVGVDPAFRRRGFARRLLPLTIAGLRAAGFEVPRLVVTMRNTRAVQLYESVGFEFVPGGAGRLWLNLPVLGVTPSPA